MINSGGIGISVKIAKAKAVVAANSRAIGKTGNAGIGYFELMKTNHELISTSLVEGEMHKRYRFSAHLSDRIGSRQWHARHAGCAGAVLQHGRLNGVAVMCAYEEQS